MSGLKLPSINTKTLQASTFSRGVYDPKTFVTPAGFVPLDMKDFTATSPDFAAAAYVNPRTGELVVAYRGSDSKTDLVIAQQAASGGKWNAQFTDAANFAVQAKSLASAQVSEYADKNGVPEYLRAEVTPLYTGHSLGGLLATVTSKMFGNEAVVFDAPGGGKLLSTPEFAELATANNQPAVGYDVTDKIQNFTVTSVISGLGDPMVERTWLPVLGQPSFTEGLITLGSVAVNPALGLLVGGATKVVDAHSSVTIEEAMYTLAGLQPHLPNAGPLTVQNMYMGTDGKPTASSYRSGEEPGGTTRVQALVDEKGNAVAYIDQDAGKPVAVVVSSGTRIAIENRVELDQRNDATNPSSGNAVNGMDLQSDNFKPSASTGTPAVNGAAPNASWGGEANHPMVPGTLTQAVPNSVAPESSGATGLRGSAAPVGSVNLDGPAGSFWPNALDVSFEFKGSAGERDDSWSLTSDQLRERYGADQIPKPGASINLAATGDGVLTDGGFINGFGSGASAVGTSPAEPQVQVGNVFSFNNGTVAPVTGTGGLQTNLDIATGAAPRSRSGTSEVLSDGPSAFVAGVEAGASGAVTNIPALAGTAGKVAPGAAYVGAINDTINVGQHVLQGNGAEVVTETLGVVGQASGAVAGANAGLVLGTLAIPISGPLAPFMPTIGASAGAGLGAYYGADGWKKIGAALTGGDTPDKLGPPKTLPNDAALQPTITTPDGSKYALVQVDGKYTWFAMLDNSGLAVANQYVEVTRGAQIAELTNNYLGASGFSQQVANHNAQVAADNTQIAQDTFIRSEINTQNATAPNGQPYGTRTQTAPNANQIWNQTSQPGLDTRTTDVRNGDGSVTRIVENIDRSTGKVDSVRTYENDNGANPNSPDSFHLVGLIDNKTGVTQAVNRDTGQMEQIAGPTSTGNTTPTLFNPATALSNSNADHTITVLTGDTVTSIATRWGMEPAAYEGYLREQYGPNADLNSIVAGRKLPLPPEVYDRTMGGVNGLDLPAESNNDGSDAHFNHHLTTDAAPKGDTITGGADAATQQIIDAFSNPVVISKENDVQLADASGATGTGTRTASDAGTGGIGLGNASTPKASEPNQPVALANNGDTAPDSVAPKTPEQVYAAKLYDAQVTDAGTMLSFANSIIGLRNWDSQNDLGHLSTLVGTYNTYTRLGTAVTGVTTGVSIAPTGMEQFGAGISLITSLKSGNPIAVASSGAALYNSFASAANVIPAPYINFLNIGNALQTGDPFAIASSVASCFPPWGTVASVVISILGGLRKPDIPPPPDGSVHYTWDETGAITIQTDHDVSGGAATANSTAGSVLTLLQSAVTDHNATNDAKGHSDNNLGIDPSRMPTIGFTAGTSWIEITHPDGSKTKETLDPDNAAEQILRAAVASDAVAPVWQIQTAQAHAKAEHTAQVEAQAQATTTTEPALESANAIDGQSPVTAPATTTPFTVHNTAAVFGTEGKVVEASDHKTQTFDALVVHLHSPTAQDAAAAIGNTPKTNTVLQDVDGDGFWEQTQWVASQDDAGNAQGMLVLDRNNNGVIDATDILHTGGDASQHNSLAWLDANADGKLDANDPAFAAIKVFIDLNNDGRVDDGEMQSPQLSSINFQTGQINYTEGPSATLTATTLSGDTEGLKLDTIKVVGVDGELEELKVGSVLVHEGYQGQVRVNSRGEIVADDDPDTNTHLVSQRINSYEFNAARLSDWEGTADQDLHRHGGGNVDGAPTETTATVVRSMGSVLGKENVKTTTTMDVGDKRITSDAPGQTTTGGTSGTPNTTITLNAGDARIRSLTPTENAQRVVFVPSGVRDGWMTADGKELLQLPDDGLFGTGGLSGALMAVALGAVQSTAFAMPDADDTGFTWQTTPLMLDGAGANGNGLNFNADAANGGNASASTISLGNYTTVHRVRLGVHLSAAPLADATAPSYTIADATHANPVQTPTGATNYASANPSAPATNTAPTQTLIDNQLTPKAKTPAITTTQPADPASNTETTAPTSPTTSTTSPATQTPTTPVPPSPTLVAIAPTAPAAVTPTTGNDQLSSNPLEDTSLHVSFATLLANDSNASSITAVGNATHGSVAIIGGEVVFTPSQNYFGPASFVYQVVSTDGNFALGQADFDISGVNDVPLVLGETANANEDIALVLSQTTLLANDTDVDVATDGQTLSVSAVGNASHGTVSILGSGSVQFIADADFHGAASFTYVVSDGHGGTAVATATVQVASVNDTPEAVGEVITSAEDTTLLVSQAALLANDTDADVATDGQTLSISAVSNASHGTVSMLGSGQIQFIPDANYAGSASFDYVVDDGNGGTVTTTANILVGSEDDAPVASGETVNSLEDQSVVLTAAALLVNETDIDNAVSSLSISRVTGGAGGSAVLNVSGNVVFTPNANFSGTASFTYWVKDPDGMESNPATVTLNVQAVNDAPYAQGELLSGASEDAVFNIDRSTLLGNDGDEEDAWNQLSIELVGGASSGTVAMGAGGNLVFTPTANFNGNVSFQYQVRDTSGAASPTVTAQFNVAAVNDNPLGVDDQLTPMYTNTAAAPSVLNIGFNTLVGNDTDVDNPPSDLTVGGVRNAVNGTAVIVGGQVTFTPTQDFIGLASFEYQVSDQHGGQTWATAMVNVAPPPNLYPSINVTYFNFYPSGTTPAGAWDIGDLSWTIADDGNTGLVSVTYLGGSYHVFGDPGGPMSSLPWNEFPITQTSWHVDVPRDYAVDSFTTTWRVIDDRGLQNTWHFNYTVGSSYQSYMDFTGYAPPVVLGLHGDSPHYIETQYSNVRYDLNGDGVADQVAWAAPGSGVLGIDLNGDQRISNANEFAFSHYVPGAKTDLEGLRAFDSNHNGVLDAGDAQWAKFGVWEDKNSDGVTQDGEYQTLDVLGIANINLNGHTPTQAQDKPADGHLTGVAVVGESSFTRTDGSTGQVDDAMLAFGVAPTVAPYSHEAEVMRMALLFNQMCNTASQNEYGDHAALGFVPIQTDGHWQDAVVAVPQGALQESFN